MDDSRVIPSKLDSALNQGQAYVLFYVRVDSDFHKPTPIKNFISQTTPNGIKLSNISSPELAIRHQNHQKLSPFNTTSKMMSPTQLIVRKPIQSKDPKNNASDSDKQNQSSDRKPNHLDSNGKNAKCLVPYANDSSDEDSPKQTNHSHNHINGCLNCDNSHNNDTISKRETNCNENNSQKELKTENALPKVKLNSNQSIPSPKPKPEKQTNVIPINTSDSSSCPPLAPITLKVKATTSSWQVVETALRSPSIASNSSTNSVNSTTEWTVSDCKPDLNGKQSKHQKHKNKNRYLTANGCVSQLMSTNDEIPQNEQQNSQSKRVANEPFNDLLADNVKSEQKTSHKNQFNVCLVNRNSESLDSHSFQKTDHLDAKSISSRRSSSDSQKEEKRRSKERDRSRSKSGNSEDDKNVLSSHRHDKKRKRDSNDSRSDDIRDFESKEERLSLKIKHKKKKKKSKKHKKRERSLSESEESDDQLQWVERTKETVERERNTDSKICTLNTYYYLTCV